MNIKINEIESTVMRIIAETLDVDLSIITQDLSIGEIPEWNSIGNMSIIASIEEQMQVEIPMEDLFELTSVSSIVDEIKRITQ